MTIEEWDSAHAQRLMIAPEVDFRVVTLAERWKDEKAKFSIRWLDVGCGTARSAEWLSNEGFDVCGFDSSPAAIERALYRLTAPTKQRPRLPRLIVADATRRWPYCDEMFDALVDIRSLENLTREELDLAWEQAARVLKPGGWFLSVCAFLARDDALTTVGKVVKLDDHQLHELVTSVGLQPAYLAANTLNEGGKTVHDWHLLARKPEPSAAAA